MILNAEMAYINWYLSEKEYHLTHHVRKALDTIDWLIRKKRKSKALTTKDTKNTKREKELFSCLLWL